MKKLLLINSVCGIGSTGRICLGIAKQYEADGYDVKIAYGRNGNVGEGSEKYALRIGTDFDVKLHALYTRITDKHGLGSIRATKKFLRWADEYDPEIVWLHNIHGYYINYELLFEWIKSRPQMEVKWTLHDCWAFTGHCSHFTYVKCDKWKIGCKNCPQMKEYPSSACLDNSEDNYLRKKRAFCGVNNLTLITPSCWLEKLIKESFLKDYPVEVRHNTIDKAVFKPTQSDFKQKHGIKDDQIMILGVSSVWNSRKGLNDFIELDRRLNSEKYRIVLIGIANDKAIELKESTNIVPISRTENRKELAGIYSCTDIYINLSREETFGMTTLEAINCGASVIVYKDTACEEVLNTYGAEHGKAVDQNIEAVIAAVTEIGA